MALHMEKLFGGRDMSKLESFFIVTLSFTMLSIGFLMFTTGLDTLGVLACYK